MITHLFLIRAVRPIRQTRMDCIIEARDESEAWFKFRHDKGADDAQPDFPAWEDVDIDELPMLTGEVYVYDLS
jgi:hypothetical protein